MMFPMPISAATQLCLFGGDRPWDPLAWVAQDDRVHGGSSKSHLEVPDPPVTARFYGYLDVKTLGGAGFASQRTRGVLHLDLSAFRGGAIVVSAVKADGKRYVLTLKNELPDDDNNNGSNHRSGGDSGGGGGGGDKSGVSWEAEFAVDGPGPADVTIPWSAFKATYRGRPSPDARPLDLSNIKRIGLMMRSFFGEQEGPFSLEMRAITVVTGAQEQQSLVLPPCISAS